jgi:hypothetical protein
VARDTRGPFGAPPKKFPKKSKKIPENHLAATNFWKISSPPVGGGFDGSGIHH